MTALYIIALIVLFFALILSLRVKLYIRQTDSLKIRAGVGPVVLTLLPKKQKKVKISDFTRRKHAKRLIREQKLSEKKASKKAARDAKKKKTENLSGEIKKSENASSADVAAKINGVLEIIKFVLDEFPKLASYTITEIKMLNIKVAGSDAADCANKYAATSIITSLLIELLQNKTKMKNIRANAVSVVADFLAEKTQIALDISLKISIFSILRVGIHTLKWIISKKINEINNK